MKKNKLNHNDAWEKAYLQQSHDAAIGRLYRGLVHNMNGDIQAITMQSELISMMFVKADELLARIVQDLKEGGESLELLELREMLKRRASLHETMGGSVRSIQNIMRRTASFQDFEAGTDSASYTLNSIITDEVDFLKADSFFKHKVHKQFSLNETLPPLKQFQLEVHQIICALLENAVDAMRSIEGPHELFVESTLQNGKAEVLIRDNGPGISPENMERIFEPFFTTKENASGLGLYMANTLAHECNSVIHCESKPGCTQFKLSMPVF
ncbi:MAG: sensor histidine kinase [Proteobacteria bacterium]|nr:sensor histidine kinase [Pseudomonadota bacterium]MBU1711009.1 sensor histidine kinase [Pseudomonadota bacterium]